MKLTHLVAGQTARVLQLPIAAERPEHIETEHVDRSFESRIGLSRGPDAILMPNQGAVLLWHAVRGTAIRVSAAVVQSFRYLNHRKQHASHAAADEEIEVIKGHAPAAKLPRKRPAAQIPEKKIEAAA